MALLFLQQVARGAVGSPGMAYAVKVGVAPSIRHLPAARRVRGVSHAKRRTTLSFDIQTGGCPRVRCQGDGKCKLGEMKGREGL